MKKTNDRKVDFDLHLANVIREEKQFQSSFFDLTNNFEKNISAFDFSKESVLISDYFSIGKGQKGILKKLISEKKVQEKDCRQYLTRDENIKYDFKGIYFFLLDNKPFYIGISKGVIGRICQHLKGKNHNTSSLAYKLGLLRYEYLNDKKYSGKRKDLNFVSEVEPVRHFYKSKRLRG